MQHVLASVAARQNGGTLPQGSHISRILCGFQNKEFFYGPTGFECIFADKIADFLGKKHFFL